MVSQVHESEGVIQFRFELRTPSAADRIDDALLGRLEAARLRLLDSGMVGRSAERYGGYAFGNVSVRDPGNANRFFISASQVIDTPRLDSAAWPRIDAFDPVTFEARVTGDLPPSSETVTHGVVYSAAADIQCIVHVHAPELWRNADALGLATTGRTTTYGSPQLARDVEALLGARVSNQLIFATPGHQDGVFACGARLIHTVDALLDLAARAEVLKA